jgi:hypothetical protein
MTGHGTLKRPGHVHVSDPGDLDVRSIGDVTKVNQQRASRREERIIREVAQLIYNAIFRPGEEIDGFIMPSFEEAQLQELGDFDRAMEAAACVVLHKSPHGLR